MSLPQELIELNDVDRRIWEDELGPFLPERIYDVHSHCYRWKFNTDPDKESGREADLFSRRFPTAGFSQLDAADAALLPGRMMRRLSFGWPFWPSCDFEASNRFTSEQVRMNPGDGALMLVHPSMSEEYLETWIQDRGFLGFKPYRFYSRTGDQVECRITDFLPEEQIAVADRHGLIIMLHVSKRDAIADPENIGDLLRLTAKYGSVKWILAHCARSYSAWTIERVKDSLRGLPNVWYDTSSVCEADAIEALTSVVGPDRVMYGSDDFAQGVVRGKYIAFGYAWAFLSESNHSMDLSHCNPQMTFSRYEQLRAMRRTALRMGFDRGQIEDTFFNTAARLVSGVAKGLR